LGVDALFLQDISNTAQNVMSQIGEMLRWILKDHMV
jgi:hypothetical protein